MASRCTDAWRPGETDAVASVGRPGRAIRPGRAGLARRRRSRLSGRGTPDRERPEPTAEPRPRAGVSLFGNRRKGPVTNVWWLRLFGATWFPMSAGNEPKRTRRNNQNKANSQSWSEHRACQPLVRSCQLPAILKECLPSTCAYCRKPLPGACYSHTRGAAGCPLRKDDEEHRRSLDTRSTQRLNRERVARTTSLKAVGFAAGVRIDCSHCPCGYARP